MDENVKAEEVRRRMAALRRELDVDVQSMGDSARAMAEQARAMADWRYYVERFPFAVAGAAVLAGYLLVPRRPRIIVPDAEALAEMARKKEGIWVGTGTPKPQGRDRGMLSGLLALAATAATKAAVNWATQQVHAQMSAKEKTRQAASEQQEAESRPGAYPPR